MFGIRAVCLRKITIRCEIPKKQETQLDKERNKKENQIDEDKKTAHFFQIVRTRDEM